MADVAAEQILNGNKTMRETIDMSTQLKLIGVEVASFGDPFIENENVTAIIYENKLKSNNIDPNIISNSAALNGGATLFLTTFTFTLFPTASSPSLICAILLISKRTEA